jgi:hypothetical protein
MGFLSWLFNDSDSGSSGKYSHRYDDNKSSGDKLTFLGGEKHTHENYSFNKDTGSYKEYHGGENSTDRSYNKK